MKNKLILVSISFIITTSLFSQTTTKYIDTGSVKNQFDFLIKKSYKYKNYKNVDINWLYKLKSNVSDSLSASKKEISTNYSTINSHEKTIDSLNTLLINSNTNITILNNEKESIYLFGIQLDKSFFKILLFSTIAILLLFLIIFITKFKQSYKVISHTKKLLEETEEEFENHRKVALEREQKVMRKLQDELNKQKKE